MHAKFVIAEPPSSSSFLSVFICVSKGSVWSSIEVEEEEEAFSMLMVDDIDSEF